MGIFFAKYSNDDDTTLVPTSLHHVCQKLSKNDRHTNELDFYGNVIGGNDGAVAIANSLIHNTRLQSISLVNNKISDLGATALAECIPCTHVTKFCFYGARMGIESCRALSNVLQSSNTKLEVLSLFCCKIGNDGAVVLAKGLQDNDSLQELDLEGNRIGNRGAKALAVALRHNVCLKCFNVLINPIGHEGARALIQEGLSHNVNLEELHVHTESSSLKKELDYFLRLNRAGRRLLTEEPVNVVDSEWALVLAKVAKEPDLLYYFALENPSLFSRSHDSL